MLPYLFPERPVLTTNYDRIIEIVYRSARVPFDNGFGPTQVQLTDQTFQRNRRSLFKVHGDIGSMHFAYDGIVFTERQYDEAYREGGPLRRALTEFMAGRMLFFLGL